MSDYHPPVRDESHDQAMSCPTHGSRFNTCYKYRGPEEANLKQRQGDLIVMSSYFRQQVKQWWRWGGVLGWIWGGGGGGGGSQLNAAERRFAATTWLADWNKWSNLIGWLRVKSDTELIWFYSEAHCDVTLHKPAVVMETHLTAEVTWCVAPHHRCHQVTGHVTDDEDHETRLKLCVCVCVVPLPLNTTDWTFILTDTKQCYSRTFNLKVWQEDRRQK